MRLPQTFPLIFSLSLSHDRPSATQIRHSSTGLEPGWGLCDTKFSDLSFNLAMHSTFYLALPLLQIVLLKKMYFWINLIDHVGRWPKPMASNSLMLKLYPIQCLGKDRHVDHLMVHGHGHGLMWSPHGLYQRVAFVNAFCILVLWFFKLFPQPHNSRKIAWDRSIQYIGMYLGDQVSVSTSWIISGAGLCYWRWPESRPQQGGGDGSLLRSLSDLMPVVADQTRCDDPTQSCDQSHGLRSDSHALWYSSGAAPSISVYDNSVMPGKATGWKSHPPATAFTCSTSLITCHLSFQMIWQRSIAFGFQSFPPWQVWMDTRHQRSLDVFQTHHHWWLISLFARAQPLSKFWYVWNQCQSYLSSNVPFKGT